MRERRSAPRQRPPVPLRLSLEVGSEMLWADVLDVSRDWLLVRFDRGTGRRLLLTGPARGRIESPRQTVPLTESRIRAVRGDGVVVELTDAASSARLWALLDDLIQSVRRPEVTSVDDPGPVPGRGEYTERSRLRRAAWLKQHSGATLASLDGTRLDARSLTGNIENFVGSVDIPVGLAGPLLFHGEHARGHIVAPMATTEGALVASASRGATAISRSGGVRTKVMSQRMVRAPVYEFADLHAAARFVRWVDDHMRQIRDQVREVSGRAQLIGIEPLDFGHRVSLRFIYETADAAGQNMTTACTWHACQWITQAVADVPGLDVRFFAIEGNSSGDKKANHLSYLTGRGSRVTAECVLDRETLHEVLKTTPEAMERGHRIGTVAGVQIGMLGYSVNAANAIAAIFAATGQDIACVHESGAAIFSVELVEDGLRATMVLPSLIVGTVGGGTGLPAQRDLLEAMECAGANRAARLAEIICGFALSLDLSTQAAVTSGQFADAHQRLGRNRPVRWLRSEDLTPAFFEPMLAEALGSPELRVSRVDPIECETGSSIVSELTSRGVGDKLVGLYPVRLSHQSAAGAGFSDVVAKVKPLDAEIILASNKIASLCGGELARAYSRWRDWTGFHGTHARELAIYRDGDPRLRAVLPFVYGVHEDPEREAYVIVMERLDGSVSHKDTVDDPTAWTPALVDTALRQIAGVHAIWLGREDELRAQEWLGRVMTGARMDEMRELWSALVEHNTVQHPGWASALNAARLVESIHTVGLWWSELERMPRTLVHNDFNLRNVALRNKGRRLVAYDWELATLHVPQRDLVEFLAFVLPPDTGDAAVERHVEAHREALEAESGIPLDGERWRHGYMLALKEFAIARLQLYMMGHTFHEYSFLERVVPTVGRLLQIEDDRCDEKTLARLAA
jgi:hydroxymethylglutaryl-CoA reductase (NADPH)